MSKIVLVTLGLAMISSGSSLRGPLETSNGNYDDLELVIQAFMDSYTGTSYNMSVCLQNSTQANLDRLLVASLKYVLVLDFEDFLSAFEDFISALATECNKCGLNQVYFSLNNGIDAKGTLWYGVNLADNFDLILKNFKSYTELIAKKEFVQAGSMLGELTSVLIPYTPNASSQLGLRLKSTFSTNYMAWWKGFIQSLSISSTKLGSCGKFMTNFANSTLSAANDVNSILHRNITGAKNLFGDIASSLTYFQKFYHTGLCNFEGLKEDISELEGSNGLRLLLSRYVAYSGSINTAFLNLVNCTSNYAACGSAVGTLIKDLLGWSIN